MHSGEKKWITISRAIVAALFTISIVLYAIFTIILEPVHGNALMPTKEIRAQDLSSDFRLSSTMVWNVLLVSFL